MPCKTTLLRSRSLSALALCGAFAGLWAGCSAPGSASPNGGSAGSTASGGGSGGGETTTGSGGETTTVVPDDGGVPDVDPGKVDDSPTAPLDDAGGKLAWPDAPLLDGVNVAANRDSAQIVLPVVAGAKDYRVFAIPEGVSIETDADGHETVNGTTIDCAGFRQHNAPPQAAELLRRVEVPGLSKATRLVVEAIDTPCPFAGVMGVKHADVVVDNVEVEEAARGSFSVYTEAEIKQKYGSLIVNGHGPADHAGSQAPPAPPKVLARTTLLVTPAGYDPKPMPFFEDFAKNDPPVFVSDLPEFDRTQRAKLYQNERFSFTTYGADVAQFFTDRGRMHTLLADVAQDIFASNVMYPRKAVALSGSDYLHVTFEVASDATQRRYWWLVLCGAEQAGATMDANGTLLGNIIQTPAFSQDDGLDPSVEGWNCLQVFPRDGYAFTLPPDDTNPESEVRVMVNQANMPLRESVVDVSPEMYPPAIGPRSWYRQRNGAGDLTAPILDDQQLVAPSTHFDFYIRRDRVVMYVNGEQRLCNDFPSVALTMAEGALGFGQVLYHSAAERQEFSASYWDRTGQRYYLENTPFIDARAWDNIGYSEHVAPPADFNAADCYVHAP